MKKIVIMILALMAVMPMCAQETAEQKDARRRAFIDDFLATYEAAYEKKKIEYIKNFFSDDALIITEKKKEIMADNDVKEFVKSIEEELSNKGRVLLRASGTEPKIRIMAECENSELAKEIANKMKMFIEAKL